MKTKRSRKKPPALHFARQLLCQDHELFDMGDAMTKKNYVMEHVPGTVVLARVLPDG